MCKNLGLDRKKEIEMGIIRGQMTVCGGIFGGKSDKYRGRILSAKKLKKGVDFVCEGRYNV